MIDNLGQHNFSLVVEQMRGSTSRIYFVRKVKNMSKNFRQITWIFIQMGIFIYSLDLNIPTKDIIYKGEHQCSRFYSKGCTVMVHLFPWSEIGRLHESSIV